MTVEPFSPMFPDQSLGLMVEFLPAERLRLIELFQYFSFMRQQMCPYGIRAGRHITRYYPVWSQEVGVVVTPNGGFASAQSLYIAIA